MRKLKYLVLVAAMVLITSCAERDLKPGSYKLAGYEPRIEYTIIKIDGCEYLSYYIVGSPHSNGLTHKGNCNNPIHNK